MYSPFHKKNSVSINLTITPLKAYPEHFSTPQEALSLEHKISSRGLKELKTATSLSLPNVKHPLHLGGVKQWLKEDLLNSSMPWWGLEPGTSASAVRRSYTCGKTQQ